MRIASGSEPVMRTGIIILAEIGCVSNNVATCRYLTWGVLVQPINIQSSYSRDLDPNESQ